MVSFVSRLRFTLAQWVQSTMREHEQPRLDASFRRSRASPWPKRGEVLYGARGAGLSCGHVAKPALRTAAQSTFCYFKQLETGVTTISPVAELCAQMASADGGPLPPLATRGLPAFFARCQSVPLALRFLTMLDQLPAMYLGFSRYCVRHGTDGRAGEGRSCTARANFVAFIHGDHDA